MPSSLTVSLLKQGLTRHIGTNVRALNAGWRSIGNATWRTARKVRDLYVKDQFVLQYRVVTDYPSSGLSGHSSNC